jgi:hypothetical protein
VACKCSIYHSFSQVIYSCQRNLGQTDMADIRGASALLDRYKKLINSGEYDAARNLLTELKLKVVEFTALPPQLEQTPTAQKELMIARDMLEQSVLLAVKSQVCSRTSFRMAPSLTRLLNRIRDIAAAIPPQLLFPVIGCHLHICTLVAINITVQLLLGLGACTCSNARTTCA